MDIMGIEAIYPKPNTSMANKEHMKFPYLLKGVEIKDQIKSGRQILLIYL